MEGEQIIIKAGPLGIVLGRRTLDDMQKLRFLVSLAGTYEYVQNGSLRLLSCERKKDTDDALADPKIKSRVDLLGESDGTYYLAADQSAAIHLLRKYTDCFRIVDEASLIRLLEKIGGGKDTAVLKKYQKLQKPAYVGTEVKLPGT